MLLIFETCEKAGLAESIALEKFHVRQKLSTSPRGFASSRTRSISAAESRAFIGTAVTRSQLQA